MLEEWEALWQAAWCRGLEGVRETRQVLPYVMALQVAPLEPIQERRKIRHWASGSQVFGLRVSAISFESCSRCSRSEAVRCHCVHTGTHGCCRWATATRSVACAATGEGGARRGGDPPRGVHAAGRGGALSAVHPGAGRPGGRLPHGAAAARRKVHAQPRPVGRGAAVPPVPFGRMRDGSRKSASRRRVPSGLCMALAPQCRGATIANSARQ
jgi:hypothetical protein